MSRYSGHYEKVISLLKYNLQINSSINLKINTMVSNINKDDIINLVDIIERYKISRWKLMQFFPIRHRAKINKDQFYISDKEYKMITQQLKNIINNRLENCIVDFTNKEDLAKTYFVIDPNGDVNDSSNGNSKQGNLLIDEVEDIWGFKFNKKNHYNRYNWLSN